MKRVNLTTVGADARERLAACLESAPVPFGRLTATQRGQLRDLLRLALDPQTDLTEAQTQAARILGITLD